jgi:hypothetical protein|tara:strand:+ start:870 stop:2042 length:1173 start_codon:yes stop_codon:yes gene_type:complete
MSSTLINKIKDLNSELATLNEAAVDERDTGKIAALTDHRDSLLEVMTELMTKPPTSFDTNFSYRSTVVQISKDVTDTIKILDTSDYDQLTNFVRLSDHVYKTSVKPFLTDHPKLEQHFVQRLKGRLSPQMAESLPDDDENSFDQFKTWLKTKFGSQFTIYQHLERAWDTEFLPAEPFLAYATKVQKNLDTAWSIIADNYKSKKGETISAEAFRDVVGGMLMVTQVKTHRPAVYTALMNQFDSLYTASDIARQADRCRDVLGKDTVSEEIFYGNKKYSNQNKSHESNPPINISKRRLEDLEDMERKYKAGQVAAASNNKRTDRNAGNHVAGYKGKNPKNGTPWIQVPYLNKKNKTSNPNGGGDGKAYVAAETEPADDAKAAFADSFADFRD